MIFNTSMKYDFSMHKIGFIVHLQCKIKQMEEDGVRQVKQQIRISNKKNLHFEEKAKYAREA